jgi:hypothetical protein
VVSVKDDTPNSSKLIPEYGYERRFSEWSWRLCKIHPFWQGFEKCEKPVDADTTASITYGSDPSCYGAGGCAPTFHT